MRLTNLQEKIFSEIKEDIKSNLDMSINKTARRHYVSPALLVKISQKMGYSGYRSMIYSLMGDAKKYDIARDFNPEMFQKVFISNYSEEMVSSFVSHFIVAKNEYIYAAGNGYSSLVVEYLSKRALKKDIRLFLMTV